MYINILAFHILYLKKWFLYKKKRKFPTNSLKSPGQFPQNRAFLTVRTNRLHRPNLTNKHSKMKRNVMRTHFSQLNVIIFMVRPCYAALKIGRYCPKAGGISKKLKLTTYTRTFSKPFEIILGTNLVFRSSEHSIPKHSKRNHEKILIITPVTEGDITP